MKKLSIVHKITRVVVDITILLGIAGCCYLPFVVSYISNIQKFNQFNEILLLITLLSSAVCCVFMFIQLRNILKLVVAHQVFSNQTVSALRYIALASASIAIIYVIKGIFLFDGITFSISFIFFFLTLIFLTLKDVFKEAVAIKLENEATI